MNEMIDDETLNKVMKVCDDMEDFCRTYWEHYMEPVKGRMLGQRFGKRLAKFDMTVAKALKLDPRFDVVMGESGAFLVRLTATMEAQDKIRSLLRRTNGTKSRGELLAGLKASGFDIDEAKLDDDLSYLNMIGVVALSDDDVFLKT